MCAEFLQIFPAVRLAAALVCHYREHMLAPEMQFLKLAEYSAGISAPPAWSRDNDVVIIAYVPQILLEFRAGVISLFLLRNFSA